MGLQPGKNHDYSHSDYSGTNWLVYNDYTMINILNCQVIKYLDEIPKLDPWPFPANSMARGVPS